MAFGFVASSHTSSSSSSSSSGASIEDEEEDEDEHEGEADERGVESDAAGYYDVSMSDNLLPAAASDPKWAATWLELGQGAPTLAGLARVASISLATGGDKSIQLSREARGLLFAARKRAVLEVKGSNRAFDAPGRMLAVYVEVDAERTLIFRSRDNPAYTIRCLAGFRELCAAGLVMHHINAEFSLTREGLDLAQSVPEEEVCDLLALATEFGVLE